MFYDSLTDLGRVLVVGTLAYLWVVAVLRVTGKRTLAQLNAFDFVVTVALGSTLATVLLSTDVSLSEGALALALLAALQLAGTWLTSRFPAARKVVTSAPTVLLRDGVVLEEALRAERITPESLLASVRASGLGGLELVAAVVLETNGTLSVIPATARGSGDACAGLLGASAEPPQPAPRAG